MSIVDLTSRITSLTTAILLLFQFVFSYRTTLIGPNKMKRYIKSTTLLRERPGLQNITYVAKFDEGA